jgi:hypothetical protein
VEGALGRPFLAGSAADLHAAMVTPVGPAVASAVVVSIVPAIAAIIAVAAPTVATPVPVIAAMIATAIVIAVIVPTTITAIILCRCGGRDADAGDQACGSENVRDLHNLSFRPVDRA